MRRAVELRLDEATIDPLELPAYRQMINDLNEKSASVR
jgi:hypothetical protein